MRYRKSFAANLERRCSLDYRYNTDCMFFGDNEAKPSCRALTYFYVSADNQDRCYKCTFYKKRGVSNV